MEALKAAVSSNESIETIQELFEGGKVPKDIRAEFWKVTYVPNPSVTIHISNLCILYTK